MMYAIFNDLQKSVKKNYSNNNVITINKYLHHSLKYEEVKQLLIKYKTDLKKLEDVLLSHINKYEIDKKYNTTIRKNNFAGRGLPKEFETMFEGFFDEPRIANDENTIYIESDLKELFEMAKYYEANKLQKQQQEGNEVASLGDISFSSFLRALIDLASAKEQYAYILNFLKDSNFDFKNFIKDDKAGNTSTKPIIDDICTNLNELAKKGKIQKVIGREDEINHLVNILNKARKNNPILVGKAGTGKTAIVEGLAKKIVDGDVPESLKNAIIYNLEIVNIVKDTSYRGQFEKKMSALLAEFKSIEENGGKPILFIDELHTIMGAGSSGQGSLDFSNIIKPALARGELRTIGATTTDEWHKFIKENPALDRRFVSVSVKEPSKEDAIKIISESISYYEGVHKVVYDKGAVERAVELSGQFIVDNALPDKAFDLIDVAGAMANVKGLKKVSVEDIEYSLAKHKNIDLDSIMESRKDKIEPLAPKIKKFIFGQDLAVEKVSRTAEKAIAGLHLADKPYGSFLFTGSTGTGKTELAKQLAKQMKANFYRIDCSELQEGHSIAKLIGSPAGYVGYDDGSTLTKIINENPRTVLLLDEIEKAHESIYKLFLQAMDYGKITDSKGREINFKNVLIIMTSNAIADERISKKIGLAGGEEKRTIVNRAVERIFSPEFRARLTGNAPIEFNDLQEEQFNKIILKNLDDMNNQRLKEKKIKVVLSDEVMKDIANHGISRKLGARPIKDYMEDKIVEPLIDQLLFGKFKGLKKLKTVKFIKKDDKIMIEEDEL